MQMGLCDSTTEKNVPPEKTPVNFAMRGWTQHSCQGERESKSKAG